jgi:hypothetical protein
MTRTAGAGLRQDRAVSAERERERARLREMGRGSESGCGRCSKKARAVGGRSGRGSRRMCASARALVHSGRGEGGADRGGPTAQRERERGRTRVTARRTDKAGPRGRGGEGRGGEGNWCRQPGPTGKREGKSECAGKGPPLTGGTHLSGDVGARARGLAGSSWAGWAALAFSFSLDFLICFSIPFSLGFLIQI